MADHFNPAAAEDETCNAEGDLEPGARVDQWVIEKRLGSGGFGTVYEARQPIIGKRVAIKVLARRYSVDPKAVARFVAEARIVNQIRHASIVDIFAFGTLEDGRQYHVMELCEGPTLEALVARRHRLDLDEALPILRGIASALDAAHDQGGVHRDLKPENVIVTMVDGIATPKVIDFGIVKLIGETEASVTDSGAVMGTPRYMSPEQCRGRDVDARSDVYSFGVLAYELLTGERPFSGEDAFELMLKHTSERPRPPSAIVPELGKSVDSIVLLLLEKDRNRRPQRLLEVIERLEQSAEAAARTADPARPPAASGGARRGWLWVGAAAGLAGAVAVAWGATRSDARGPKAEEAAAPHHSLQRTGRSAAAPVSTIGAIDSAQATQSTRAGAPSAQQTAGETSASPVTSPRPARAPRRAARAAPRLDDVEDPFHR